MFDVCFISAFFSTPKQSRPFPTMSEVIYRSGKLEDSKLIVHGQEEIIEIQNESKYWSDAVRRELLEKADNALRCVDADHRFVIAEVDGQAAGFVSFVNSRKTPYVPSGSPWWHEYTWVSYVWVDAKYRGRGIADALMREADNHARASGLWALYDDVYDCNPRSQAFHEKMGYRYYAQVAVRENLDFVALRESVSALRAALPTVVLEAYDVANATHRAAIRSGLIEVYGGEGEYGKPYGSSVDMQIADEAFFDANYATTTTVARDGDAIIGWIVCGKSTKTPYGVHYGEWWHSFASLGYVWVASEHRRRNVAQLLLDNALVEVGEPVAISSFVIENEPSKRWHAKQQFIPLVRVYHKRLLPQEQANQ
jgi:ribosomal protein S18 acetylase RimI-like enzyme